MFSMLRSRVEVQLNVGPHQGARMGVPTCLNFLDVTLRASWLSALTMSSTRKAREDFNTVRTHISHLTAHMCASVWCGRMEQIRKAMIEKSAKCEALQRVQDFRSHGGRSARSTVQRPRESTNDCARSSSTWSAWISFRGVLLHHHCLTLAGPPRVHVARQLLSGVRVRPRT